MSILHGVLQTTSNIILTQIPAQSTLEFYIIITAM